MREYRCIKVPLIALLLIANLFLVPGCAPKATVGRGDTDDPATVRIDTSSVPARPDSAKSPAERTRIVDSKEVLGYLDNPTPVYIIDADDPNAVPMFAEPGKTVQRDKRDTEKAELLNPVRELEAKRSEKDIKLPVPAPGPATISRPDDPAPISRPDDPAPATRPSRAGEVRAGAHDDNEEFAFYRTYCEEHGSFRLPIDWDISERWVIRALDPDSNAVAFSKLVISSKDGKPVFSAVTPSSGEIVLFPAIDLAGVSDRASLRIALDGQKPQKLAPSLDGRVGVVSTDKRTVPSKIPVQVCFLLDATGSMKDEIDQLKDVIYSIHQRIAAHPIAPMVEFTVVAYRDRGDVFVVKGYDFTSLIDTFQMRLETIQAGGGGDYPEDLHAGFRFALDSVGWKAKAAKFVFLIADAPPHLDYDDTQDYVWAMRAARERGVMIVPIGASGLKPLGEFIFRQLGITTRGPFVFLHYGEQGESDGAATAADPGKVSHHTGSNYDVRRLDDIVVDIVLRELGYVTPVAKIVRTVPRPVDEKPHLDTRMQNLLLQVMRDPSLARKRLVVAPFRCADSSLRPLADFLWESAVERIPGVVPFTIVERQRLEDILKEHALDLTGATDAAERQVGKLLSADYILFSSLDFLGTVRTCHMRLVDCEAGTMVSAARVKL